MLFKFLRTWCFNINEENVYLSKTDIDNIFVLINSAIRFANSVLVFFIIQHCFYFVYNQGIVVDTKSDKEQQLFL